MRKQNHTVMAKIHNRFDIEVIDGKTGKIKRKARGFNVVCNQLWSCIVASSSKSYATHIHYGSGTGTPSASDTSLFNFVAAVAVSDVGTDSDVSNGVASRTVKIVLNVSDAVGVTIREVGLAYGNSSGNLTTHAMLQDMNGNPISITKTNTDIINIYATIYLHWNSNAAEFSLYPGGFTSVLLGKDTNRIDALRIGLCTTNIGRHSNYVDIAQIGVSRVVDLANKKLTFNGSRLGVSSCNWNGIRFLDFGYYYSADNVALSGVLIKASANTWSTHITGESVGVGDGTTTRFKTKFSFPTNASVYINGSKITSGVTVKRLPSTATAVRQSGYNIAGINTLYLLSVYQPENIESDFIYKPIHSVSTQNGYANISVGGSILYNPMHSEGEGISRFAGSSWTPMTIDVSDDGENWTRIATSSSDITIAQQYRASKYFKFSAGAFCYVEGTQDGNNIIFDTPPANGDVITIDYDTDCIAKDSDHVADISVTIQFGEYQGQ